MNLLSLREESMLPAVLATLLRKGMLYLTLTLLTIMSTDVFAHAVAQGDKGYIQEITGTNIIAFMYLRIPAKLNTYSG